MMISISLFIQCFYVPDPGDFSIYRFANAAERVLPLCQFSRLPVRSSMFILFTFVLIGVVYGPIFAHACLQ